MTPEELDIILRAEDDIPEPSPLFTRNVMAAVSREAPERDIRLPFPWLRFGAGLAASTVIAATGTVLLQPQTAALTIPHQAVAQLLPAVSVALFALLAGFTAIAAPRLLSRP